METTPMPSKRRISKPLGVYFISAFDALVIGLLPLGVLLFLDNDPAVQIPLLIYWLTAIVRVIIIAAALAAMMGEDLGRRVLLWAITAASLTLIYNSADLLAEGARNGSQGAGLVRNILHSLFWVVLNWVYFNKRDVVAYYTQNRDRQQQS
jgi:hypothetical protein